VNVKELKKHWSKLWTNDAHKGAGCSFCGRSRQEVHKLIEGPNAYICDACVKLCLGIIVEDSASPVEIGAATLLEILHQTPADAPFRVVDPIADAILRLSPGEAHAIEVHKEASRRGHFELSARALSSIPAEKRTADAWHDLAAVEIDLERFDAAKEALDALNVSGAAPGTADIFAECHRALLAVRTNAPIDEATLRDLVARAKQHANKALAREALQALSRHRAAHDDVKGALEAVDEALAGRETAPLHVLRGDLLSETQRDAAVAAWQRALELCHPDGVEARRARDRLESKHPYRSKS
jgi:hypothetical protein